MFPRQHLKRALELATTAQDNHLRALVLALIAAHYLHTAGDHARTMLQTCEQLAAGLGAPSTKDATTTGANGKSTQPIVVGNAPLGLWVGERFLGECSDLSVSDSTMIERNTVTELFKRFGKDSRAQKQTIVNAQFARAVEDLACRGNTRPSLMEMSPSVPSS